MPNQGFLWHSCDYFQIASHFFLLTALSVFRNTGCRHGCVFLSKLNHEEGAINLAGSSLKCVHFYPKHVTSASKLRKDSLYKAPRQTRVAPSGEGPSGEVGNHDKAHGSVCITAQVFILGKMITLCHHKKTMSHPSNRKLEWHRRTSFKKCHFIL